MIGIIGAMDEEVETDCGSYGYKKKRLRHV